MRRIEVVFIFSLAVFLGSGGGGGGEFVCSVDWLVGCLLVEVR